MKLKELTSEIVLKWIQMDVDYRSEYNQFPTSSFHKYLCSKADSAMYNRINIDYIIDDLCRSGSIDKNIFDGEVAYMPIIQ